MRDHEVMAPGAPEADREPSNCKERITWDIGQEGPVGFPDQDHLRWPTQRDIWAVALKAAAKVEKRFGLDDLGPWTDFEWAKLNGELSALRWVLGDEWDMLDT